MRVILHAHAPHWQLGSDSGVVAADARCGVHGFGVWQHALPAGKTTTTLQHTGELVLVAPGAGSGKVWVDGGPMRFVAPCTLLLPAGQVFTVTNTGTLPLLLLWVFTQPPAAVGTQEPAPARHGPK